MTRLATETPRKSLTPTLRKRPDVAPNLLHLLHADTRGDAFGLLRSIVAGRCLSASDEGIRDGSRCVSFAEAPIRQLREVYRWTAEREVKEWERTMH